MDMPYAIDMDDAPKLERHLPHELSLETSKDVGIISTLGETTEGNEGLKKTLKDRHLSMIALGGALGTGLLVGTGSALATSGPGGVLIDYTIIGFIVFLVMAALGEITSFVPMTRGFGGYATRFVDPCLGFGTGYAYLFKYLLATPNQMAAGALIIQFWTSDRVNPAVFITIFLIIIVVVNFVPVKYFGEFEFWLSSLKVIILCGVIVLMFILALGGGPNHDRTGFRYWSNPGAFAEYKAKGATGRFIGVWTTMIQAVYAFGGTELVGITVAEAKNPRIAMPKAIKMTFFRICFFYILSVFFLGMVVPYNSPELVFALKSKTSAAASPFVVAIKIANIGGLDHLINACLLVFVISSSTSDLYIATRTLYGLADDGKAPRIFTRTTEHGVPYTAMTIPVLFSLLAYMSIQSGAKLAFGYLTNMVTVFGLLTWIGILCTHIGFRKAVKAQNLPAANFPYRSPFGILGSYIATGFLCVLIMTKSFGVFVQGFDYKNFIVGYIGLPIYLALVLGYKFIYKTKRVKPCQADLVTGVPTISWQVEKANHLAKISQKEHVPGVKGKLTMFYDKVLSFLF